MVQRFVYIYSWRNRSYEAPYARIFGTAHRAIKHAISEGFKLAEGEQVAVAALRLSMGRATILRMSGDSKGEGSRADITRRIVF